MDLLTPVPCLVGGAILGELLLFVVSTTQLKCICSQSSFSAF